MTQRFPVTASSDSAELWGCADYDNIGRRFAPIHDELVSRLDVGPSDRVLDVATGTGGVAIRAARAGAAVTGVDISPVLLEHARTASQDLDLDITYDVGDAQALPYGDASFDVVASSFGVIFAPDHRAVAQELARVCRDRLGMTAWLPNAELGELYRRFGVDSPEGREPFRWGTDGYARSLLGADFELSAERRTWILEGEDGEAIWQLWATSAPPFKAMLAAMDEATREGFRAGYVAYCEQFREDGGVRVPREYLLILGRKR